MKLIEHYRQYGLEKPIHFRAGFIFHLLLWCCLGFTIGGIGMVVEMDIIGKLIGIFSFLFFGFIFLVMLRAWFKAGRYGLCMLSKEGLYMSHINITIPWQDIGPAWVSLVTTQGTTTKVVCYSIRNISRHRNRMGFSGKILVDMQNLFTKSKSGGKIDWGLGLLVDILDISGSEKQQMMAELDQNREIVLHTKDTGIFNIPVMFHGGMSAEDLVGIINREATFKHGFPAR